MQKEGKKIVETIPTEVVVEEKQREIEQELYSGITNLQTAYRGLRGIVGSECLGDVPTIHAITADWISLLIKTRQDAVRKSPVLTADQKRETCTRWESVGRQLNKAVAPIRAFLSKYPDVPLAFDEAIRNYTLSTTAIKDYAAAKSTMDVPTEAEKHYRLISAVADAVKCLREWEDERDIIRRPLPHLVHLSPSQLAEMWAQGVGYIFHDHKHRDARTEALIRINFANIF